MTRLEDWIGVLAAVATIFLSLAIAALILERGSSSTSALGAATPTATMPAIAGPR